MKLWCAPCFFPRYGELMLCGIMWKWDLRSSPIFFFPHSWRQLGLIWQPIARTHAPAKKREKNCIKIYRYLWYFNSYQVFIIASNCFITHLKQFSFAKIKWIILIYIADLKILVGQVLLIKLGSIPSYNSTRWKVLSNKSRQQTHQYKLWSRITFYRNRETLTSVDIKSSTRSRRKFVFLPLWEVHLCIDFLTTWEEIVILLFLPTQISHAF